MLPQRREGPDPNFGAYDWRPRLVWKPRLRLLLVPLWMPLVAGIATMAWALRPRRAQESACRACRYSLHGLPGDVCPECGTLQVL